MILYPAIDLVGGKAVRLFKGDYAQMTVYSEDPVSVAKDFQKAGAKRMHLVDLEAAKTGIPANAATIRAIAENTELFLEVGGGIRNMEILETYLSLGVDRAILGTAAVTDPQFLKEAVDKYGDKVAVGVDLKDGFVAIKGWTETSELTAEAFFEKNVDFEYGYSLNNINNMLECQPEVCVVSCGYTINIPTLLEIRADIAVNAAVLEKNSMEILTDMKVDEGKIKSKTNNCALTVYFVSGQENVWDIARIYNASVDEIIKINNLNDEYINDGAMLLLPIS